MKRFTGFAIAGVIVSMSFITVGTAAPVMDGRAGGGEGYGAPLSVQDTNTHFGNATLGDPVQGGGGSEIDQVFGVVANGRLYVLVAGNMEKNFNKMEVFIDSVVGGVNTIDKDALPAGVDGFCCGGFGTTSGALQKMHGLTFDVGFHADYYLTFTHGNEKINPTLLDEREFWAMSAHYANLRNGVSGEVVAAGMQLAPRGVPSVMRFPGDYNRNGIVDAADFTRWRDTLGQSVARGASADANGSQTIEQVDYDIWSSRFNDDTTLAGFPFIPNNPEDGVSETLIGPALPGLGQGKLIDRTYALGSGGCTGDTGAGCVAPELEFALDVDPSEVGTNQSSHRRFSNTIGLEMAMDNSNVAGVTEDAPYSVPTAGNPQDVTTGVEFSIPLAQIGNPSGPIKLSIFINGLLHDYASNQFAGVGILDANLGGDGFGGFTGDLSGVNLATFAGDQFITVPGMAGDGAPTATVPEPGIGGTGLVVAWALRRIRRKARRA